MIDIDIKAEFKEVERALNGLRGQVSQAMSQSINSSLKKSRTKHKGKVKTWLGLDSPEQGAKLLRLWFANRKDLNGSIYARGGKAARPSVKHISTARELKKSRVKWKSGGRWWTVGDSFKGKGKLNGHYYHRYIPGQRKITKLLGPSAADVVKAHYNQMREHLVNTTMKEFGRQIDWRLRKLGIRK